MTIDQDPNINRRINQERRADAEGWSMTALVLGGLAALALVFGIFIMMNDRPVTGTATTMDRTAPVTVTVPSNVPAQPRALETTGSGSTTVTTPTPSTVPPTAR